jgi:hypothetical protein
VVSLANIPSSYVHRGANELAGDGRQKLRGGSGSRSVDAQLRSLPIADTVPRLVHMLASATRLSHRNLREKISMPSLDFSFEKIS